MGIKIITVIWNIEKGSLKVKLLPVIKSGDVSLFIKEIYIDDVFIFSTDEQYEVLLADVRSLLPDKISV